MYIKRGMDKAEKVVLEDKTRTVHNIASLIGSRVLSPHSPTESRSLEVREESTSTMDARGVAADQLVQAQQRKEGRVGLGVQGSCRTMRERHSSTSRRHRDGVGL